MRVLNSNRTFPVIFSYYRSESKEAFSFIWESLKEECFKPNRDLSALPPPRVILGNQAAGLITLIPKAFPNCQIQSYDWHVVEAIIKHYRQNKYKKIKIKGDRDINKASL